MRILLISSVAAAASVTVLLAGCGGGNTPLNPQNGTATMLRSPSVALPGVVAPYRVARSARIAHPNCCPQMLFVSDYAANQVQLYKYPAGTSQGALAQPTLPALPFNQPQGECVDTPNPQNVFIANTGASAIDEYTQAGTFVRQLNDPGQYPVSCAYRQTGPNSGVLAVGNIYSTASIIGSISVYTDTNGVWAGPVVHLASIGGVDRQVFFVAYKGNTLYFDGLKYSFSQFYFMKMSPNGTFTPITISGSSCTLNFPGGIQHIGSYLAVGDQSPSSGCPNIYHVLPNGAVNGSTTLSPSPSDLAQFVRAGAKVVVPDAGAGNASLYDWPSGSFNMPLPTPPPLTQPVGSVVSQQ